MIGGRCADSWTQLLVVLTATMAVMSDGVHYGWSSPAVPVLQKEDSPVGPITEHHAYMLEMLYWLGGIFGLPVTVFAVDRLGRKGAILLASAQNLLAWIIIGSTSSITLMYIARFITGAAGNTSFVAAPMYIAECADAKIRGFLGTFIYTMMMVGTLLGYCAIPFIPIWASSSVGATINILQIATFVWMPETPYYCLLKDDKDKAEKSLRWLRRRSDVSEELAAISAAVERQSCERGRPQDLVIVPSNRKALLIMALLNSTQHFCGISVMLMNVQMILAESGSFLNLELSAILFGSCMLRVVCFYEKFLGISWKKGLVLFKGTVPSKHSTNGRMLANCFYAGKLLAPKLALLIAGPFVDKFGRKALLISSCLSASLFLGVLGVYFLLQSMGSLPSGSDSVKLVPLVAVLCYAFAYRSGLGLVPIVVTGEIFPTSVKAFGMTLADLIYNVQAIVSIRIYYWTSSTWGMHVPFLLFALCGIFTAICTYLFIPETKGKTLEEIQMKLKRRTEVVAATDTKL